MRLRGMQTIKYRIYKIPTQRLPTTPHQRGETTSLKRRHGRTLRLPQLQLPTTAGKTTTTAGAKKKLHGKPTTTTAGTKRKTMAIPPPSFWTMPTRARQRIPKPPPSPNPPNLQKVHPRQNPKTDQTPSTLLHWNKRPARDYTPRLLYPQRAKMTYLYPLLTKDPPSKGDPP